MVFYCNLGTMSAYNFCHACRFCPLSKSPPSYHVLNGQNPDGWNTNKNQMKKNRHTFYIGLFQKKTKRGAGRGGGELRICNFQKGIYQRNSMWIGISKSDQEKIMWNFQRFGLGISKGCNTVLHNFQGWNFHLSGISMGKVNKRKIPSAFVIYRYLMFDSKLQ